MKKKLKKMSVIQKLSLFVFVGAAALSIITWSGIKAAVPPDLPEPRVYIHEGKQFKAIPGEWQEPPKDAVSYVLTKEEVNKLERLEATHNERILIEEIGLSHPDEYGGSNVIDDIPVYYIKGRDTELEKKIKGINPNAKISYVKFSEKELDEIQKSLLEKTELGVQFAVKLIAMNQVELMITEENYIKNKDELLQDIDLDAVKLRLGKYRFVNQPGEIYTPD